MLLARSRHASVRSLERYARPGPEAVAATSPPPTRPHADGASPNANVAFARGLVIHSS